jgi:quercetin dioxygenase-like cupin family protein
MTFAKLLPVVATALILAGCTTTPPVAPSTPTTSTAPVSATDLAVGAQEGDVDVEVDGPTQVVVKEITIAPGAGTGLHCHDGQLIGVIESGKLTHYAPIYPTGVHVYSAGDSIIEGAHYVHEGKNEGTVPVVLTVTYVIPQGDPLAETDLSKCDPR